MGGKYSLFSGKNSKPARKSRIIFQPQTFMSTDLQIYDQFFQQIQIRTDSITQTLKLLQFEKSLLYHSLSLPSLFKDADSSTASTCLVLFLVASGNQIEFSDSCPYLEVSTETDLFLNFKKYVELLHLNIVSLTKLKPDLQDFIDKARDFLRKISATADKDGLDLAQKLNLIAIIVHNCKVLWKLPSVVEQKLASVKKDLIDAKNGIRNCVRMSSRFSLIHGHFVGHSPAETIRLVWESPWELKGNFNV